ncbi:MAG: glycosyltransferase [Jaaginema sp. PMC 1079.18]|nr:glycosyltransferase [Jaaginema sp. PMC 1080.18]MEC4850827.1 glycosyltransferase [Jaaginema sp. PMC 1079.18]MEC4868375.1 glycosyltransferase [Jaaginema sp. PMC 1078.18]
MFSFVIPTYNRPQRLANCLEAIAQIDYPRDRFEVVVVDDGSTVPIQPIISRFKEQLNITFISQSNAGPASARNAGVAQAQGQYIVFTDDDCQPSPDGLKNLEIQFAKTPQALIGGKTLNALPQNLCSTTSQLLIDYLYEYYNQKPGKLQFFASNNFAISKQIFQKIGGFDTNFPLAAGEDREFCDRLLQMGYNLVYASEVQVFHAHDLTLPSFWKQHFSYGRGAFYFHKVRALRNSQPIQVEPWSFYFDLLIYPFSQSVSQPKTLMTLLLFMSQLASTIGFFWERQSRKTLAIETTQHSSL